jgi:signal transduction histidine kinase
LVESQGQWGQEYRFQTRDGKVTWVYGLAAPQYDASGKITQYVGINIDITERKRAEKEQAKLQHQLTQAQKMESVGRLAGGVAHDFNNLLMGILNYAELCRDKVAQDHPIREWLNEITVDAERSAQLTHQLLAFARKQIIAPKVLDLSEAVSGMLKLLRRLIGEDITMKLTAHSDTWPVKIDPVQIDQILANLAVNARDAIGGVGSITIETSNATYDEAYCAAHLGSVPGDYALLTVSDTGCGMGPEMLEHIFEPFFTTKGVGEGTGLGLATVFGIVKQNNGYINVSSEPGKGTTFQIYLPRHVRAETAQAAVAAPAKPPRGTETILMVEDEKSVRLTTHMFLEDLGYTVLVAENPEKALALVAQHPAEIHLLITDVIMPGMSGRDLAQRLSELRPAIKRLFISGFTADVIAERGILADSVNFLSKPFGRDELARKVREVLEA